MARPRRSDRVVIVSDVEVLLATAWSDGSPIALACAPPPPAHWAELSDDWSRTQMAPPPGSRYVAMKPAVLHDR